MPRAKHVLWPSDEYDELLEAGWYRGMFRWVFNAYKWGVLMREPMEGEPYDGLEDIRQLGEGCSGAAGQNP